MASTFTSLPITQGSTISYPIDLVKESDGTPVDLSDCDTGAHVVQVYTAPSGQGGTLVTTGTLTVTAPATNGRCVVAFTPAQSLLISDPLYVWEGKFLEGAIVRRFIGGDFQGLKKSLIA
jgi:hypothetical protein